MSFAWSAIVRRPRPSPSPGKPCSAGCGARAQDVLERLRIVRVGQLAGTWQVQVVEPRYPEAQRGGAQQRGPLRALVLGQRAHGRIGTDHGFEALRVERAVVVA